MRPSPFFSRTSIASFLSLLPLITAQSIGGGFFRNGSGAPGAAPYQLVDEYLPAAFFDNFNFFTGGDPTSGHVQYVDRATALQNGYTTTVNGAARMSVDTTNKFPLGGRGRPAVRLISNNSYTHGMFIADVKHMPTGCGTWPAYWLLGPDPWPTYGEIDIIEGVHDSTENGISMHTTDGCSIAGSDQVATLQTTNCYYKLNFNSGCGSKLEEANIPNNYGKPLNDIGGGVYVTEWTASYVKHWFFPRGAIPPSITSGSPDISQFGKPTVNQQGPGCVIDQHFGNMNIIINTDFCGDWAGEVYAYFPNCPQNTAISSSRDRCVDYVGNNPTAFTEAYWDFNSIRVYQMPPGAQPVSSYSTSLASTQPLPSTNTIDAGMGRTSSSISSESYTGPLSSITPTPSLSEVKSTSSSLEPSPQLPSDEESYWSSYWAAHSTTSSMISIQLSSTAVDSSTAAPSASACPGMDKQLITAPGGRVYRLYCSSDSNGPGAFATQVIPAGQSYDGCFDVCNAESECTAFTWVVDSRGGGTCYVKRGAQASSPNPNRPDLWSFILVNGNDNPTPPSGTVTPASTPGGGGPAPSFSAAACQDGSVLNGSNGHKYTIFCPGDTTSGAFASTAFDNGDYTQCVGACDANDACGAWTWVPISTTDNRGGTCYLKRGPQTRVAASRDGLIGGTLPPADVQSTTSRNVPGGGGGSTPGGGGVSTSLVGSASLSVIDTPPTSSAKPVPTAAPCPYANGTEYISSSGKVYEIICYMDESTDPSSSAYVQGDYSLCVAECEQTAGCVSITYSAFGGGGSGGFCSFRKSSGRLTPSDDSDVHLNLIPGKSTSIGPTTTTTTTTKSSSTMSSSAAVSPSSSSVSSMVMGTPSTSITSTTSSSSTSTDEGDDTPVSTSVGGDDATTMTDDDDGEPTETPDSGDGTSSTSNSVTASATSTSSTSGSASTSTSPSSVSSTSSLSSAASSASSSPASATSSTTSSVVASPLSTSSTRSGSGSSAITSSSSGISTVSSSTAISPVTSASAAPMPGGNPACDSVFTDPRGETYLVKCASDSSSPSFRTVPVYSGGFGACFGACDTTQGCVGFTYVGNDFGNCYLKSTAGTLSSNSGNNYISAFKLSALGYSSTSQVPSPSASSSLVPGASISSVSLSASASQSSGGSSSVSSIASSIGSMTVTSRATTASTVSSNGVSSSGSSSRSTSVSYAPPPACPTSSSYYCMEADQQTTCSSGNINYAIQCGILYQGVEIDTSNINEVPPTSEASNADDQSGTSAMSGSEDTSDDSMAMITKISKRATLPDVASCRALCDRTAGCKAFNFVGTNCTLFSSVTGYSYAPGALGGTVYAQGGSPPTPVDTSPSCPGSAGKSFTDSMSMTYNIVCYTQYASGYTSDAPFASDNLANCLPTCSKNAQCAGVAFDTTTRLCQLLVAVNGAQTTNNNLIVALRVGGPPAYQSSSSLSSVPPTTMTTTLLPTSTLSLSSGATITIGPSQPVEVLTSTVVVTAPTGGSFISVSSGSFYVYPSSSASAPPLSSGGGDVICFTCGITPVVTPGTDVPTGPPASVLTSSSRSYNPTCAARPPLTGTTTVFTTYTVTACVPQPTCPASGYFIYTGTSRPGQEVVTTTNSQGSSFVFTQIPATVTPTITGGEGSGTGTGGGGGGGPTVTVPGGGANPTCPANNGEIYTANMGMQYQILCNTRFTDATLETQTQDRLDACISACDMYNTLTFYMGSQCLGINYYGEKATDNCLLKAGSNGVNEYGITAARLVTPRPGGNGTGPGTGPGDYGTTIIATMSASPVITTAPGTGPGTGPGTRPGTGPGTGPGPTQTETTTTVSVSYVPSTIYGVSTAVSTYTSNGVQYITSYRVSTAISVSYVPAPTQTVTTTTTAYVPSTVYAVSTSVSTYTSNGVQYVTYIGITTAVSISYVPAPTQTVTTTTTAISYVPSTIYEIRTTVSTYVSNGISYVTSYGVSTAVSVSYVQQTASTNTVTTTMISISISERTVSGATVTIGTGPGTGPGTGYGTGPGGGTVTVTATPTGPNTYGPGGSGGSGGGVVTVTTGGSGYMTVTMSGEGGGTQTSTTTVFVTRTVAPASRSISSSTFTCRTYATNYLNGAVPTAAFKKREVKRSVFDAEVVISENEREPRPGAMPQLWYHGLKEPLDEVLEEYLE